MGSRMDTIAALENFGAGGGVTGGSVVGGSGGGVTGEADGRSAYGDGGFAEGEASLSNVYQSTLDYHRQHGRKGIFSEANTSPQGSYRSFRYTMEKQTTQDFAGRGTDEKSDGEMVNERDSKPSERARRGLGYTSLEPVRGIRSSRGRGAEDTSDGDGANRRDSEEA